MTDQVGAILDEGPSDWQIVQQDTRGLADIALRGRWAGVPKGRVQVRLVFEDTGVAVTHSLDWQDAVTAPDGTWSATLKDIPAGGLYRLETRFNPDGNVAGEWSPRGDMRHFLGVGDLWVIAGQSNSAGYGRGPVYDPPELGVHLFRNSMEWALATQPMNESTNTKHPVNREAANSGHAPYLHFGRLLKHALNHPIGLVQTSLGGSPLCAWNPTEPGDAVLFKNMVHCVERAGGSVRGILWYQGCSDTCNDETAASYAQRFVNAVGAWRQALRNPSLPVLTVQINRVYQPPDEGVNRRWSQVRECQRQVPKKLEGIVVVPTLDLPLSDGIHISPAGNMLLAERLARAALGAVYGRPVDYLAPDIRSARRMADGRTVELTFAPVTSRIDTIDPSAHSFKVEDDAGDLPIEKVVYTGSDRVRLVLARPIYGRGGVHGGFGHNPAIVPMDMERFVPILGFYRFPIE